jgi:hypothetical protein
MTLRRRARRARPRRASIVAALALALAQRAVAGTMPTPAPSSTPAATGPCAQPALASIAVRPGIGRAPATSGAVCVAPPGVVVLGAGYRDQTTTGSGRQQLDVYPEPVALVGVGGRTELILASLAYSRRTGTSGSAFPAIGGQQDSGVGAQYLLSDRPALQQAVALFATLPTGYPAGPLGFSAGTPSYALSYTFAYSFGGKLGLSTSQGVVFASASNSANVLTHFTAYQPTVNLSYALAAATTLLLEDQITAPTGPQAPTGNRALLAVQQVLSPNFVLDAEYEINLLPAPGFAQHALGAGITARL